MAHKKKSRYGIKVALVVVVAIAIIAAFLFLTRSIASSGSHPEYAIPYINISDVETVVKNASYMTIRTYQESNFSSVLKEEGYIATSVSVFNLTSQQTNNTPTIITSSVFLMSNQYEANTMLSSMLFSNNANQSVASFVYDTNLGSNSTYVNATIRFYTISSVAVFNNSVIASIEALHETLTMPVFQFTTLFNYKDYVGIVVTNSYHYSAAVQNDSASLAEILAEKIIKASS
ncbi:MAG: hypothetical protein QW346_02795 [Candidatus Micrarchaeaceae archaeon]